MHPYLAALFGGALIGLGASILLLFSGRIAGISGIAFEALIGASDRAWRLAFLGGLLVGGRVLLRMRPDSFVIALARPDAVLIVAGLLVGFGTRLGNGCTSGHGVCGLSRLSPRSLAATLTFIATGALTVYVYRQLCGGVS